MSVPTFITPLSVRIGLAIVAVSIAVFGLVPPAEGQLRTRSADATGFDDIVFAISFSPDGRTFAIARGASDPVHRFGRIELWDAETLKLRHILQGFDGPVRSISFSPDGYTLISSSTEFRSDKLQQKARSREGSRFGELKWWDTRTGELKHKLNVTSEGSYAIRAIQSPDGKQLAVAESFVQPFPVLSVPMFGTQRPRNLDLAIGRAFYFRQSIFKVKMKLVDAQTGDLRFKLDMDQPGASSFSPDGSLLAVANGGNVKLWNPQNGKEVLKLKDLRGTANAVAFSPDGRTLAVASMKYERVTGKDVIKIIGLSEVKLFDVSTGKLLVRLSNVGAVNSLAFSPNGRILIAGGVLSGNKGETAGLKVIDFETGKIRDVPTGDYTEAVDSLALSPDGGLLAFRSGAATVKLLDTKKGTVKQTWDADSVGDAVERPTSRFLLSVKRVVAVAFSPDGTMLSGESDQGEIKFWDHRTGEVKRHLRTAQEDPSLVAAVADGRSFAACSQESCSSGMKRRNRQEKGTAPGSLMVQALALSADGRTLASEAPPT